MGTIRKGILGGFSGKVGPVIGSSWRGKDVMRSLPKKGNRIASEDQLLQRAKFGLMTRFMSPFTIVIAKYFGQPTENKARTNLAMSYHIREAISGTYPDYAVDYPKVILTKGELLGLEDADAVAQAGAIVKVTWVDNSGQSQAKADDVLLSVFYNETKKLLDWQQSIARAVGTATVQLPDSWTGDTVHCWASFVSADEKLVANSQYLGEMALL